MQHYREKPNSYHDGKNPPFEQDEIPSKTRRPSVEEKWGGGGGLRKREEKQLYIQSLSDRFLRSLWKKVLWLMV